ncbi:MAG: nitroreductase family protein [Bacillota bacterium]|nr:nitroreductase family protein [Bacillota bacterium]
MSVIDAIRERRSIRKYSGEHISDDDINIIVEAGLLAPSGRNIKPQELIIVRDQEKLKLLAGAREHGSDMLKGADCAIVVIADQSATDVWTEDCSIAMAYMHLSADALGIGSCWIQGRLRTASDGSSTEDYIRKLLDIPDQYLLEAILSLGCPAEHPQGRELTPELLAKVHYEKF